MMLSQVRTMPRVSTSPPKGSLKPLLRRGGDRCVSRWRCHSVLSIPLLERRALLAQDLRDLAGLVVEELLVDLAPSRRTRRS